MTYIAAINNVMTAARFNPDESRQVANLYADGKSVKNLAILFGCSTTSIKTAVRKTVGRIRTKKEARANRETLISQEVERQMADLYLSGQRTSLIASKFGTDTHSVFRALHRQKTAMRVHTRTHSLDENAFDNAENRPLASYFLGLMYADGCVTSATARRKAQQLVLALTESDKSIIYAFREFLGSTHAITITKPSKSHDAFANSKSSARIAIGSVKLIGKLAQYGVVPRKSGIEAVPASMALNPDWWRGVIDGDGWVSDLNGRHTIGVTGSMDTCEKFIEFARTIAPTNASIHPNKSIFSVNLKSNCADRVILKLYHDACIALPRKAIIAERIINQFIVRCLTIPDHGKGHDLAGLVFGRLTVESYAGKTGKRKFSSWHCICECGNHTIVNSGTLKAGLVVSCGCYHSEQASKRIYDRMEARRRDK